MSTFCTKLGGGLGEWLWDFKHRYSIFDIGKMNIWMDFALHYLGTQQSTHSGHEYRKYYAPIVVSNLSHVWPCFRIYRQQFLPH